MLSLGSACFIPTIKEGSVEEIRVAKFGTRKLYLYCNIEVPNFRLSRRRTLNFLSPCSTCIISLSLGFAHFILAIKARGLCIGDGQCIPGEPQANRRCSAIKNSRFKLLIKSCELQVLASAIL